MTPITDNIYFNRNIGLISEEEQQKLSKTTVAIAGAGGDGGLLAERLVRFGIGNLVIADPEIFEASNVNRQFAANQKNIGKNKAEVIAHELRLINPDVNVTVYNEGITRENVFEIVSNADLIVDEIEYSLPAISVMLHQQARGQNKYLFMGANIGWGASIFCFAPGGLTFEDHFEYDTSSQKINPLKYFKSKPAFLCDELIEEVISGNKAMPSLASSVSLVSAVLSNEIILFITAKRQPLVMPSFLFIDLFDLSIDKN